MSRLDGLAVVDSPPGDERIARVAIASGDAVIIPTRAGGVEFSRVLATLEMIPNGIRHGVVICAARLGTNDLEAAIAWWKEQQVPIFGVIPERVGLAAGHDTRLYREGLVEYDAVLQRVLRGWR